MEFQKLIGIEKRMLKIKDGTCEIDCTICPFYYSNNHRNVNCLKLRYDYPELYEQILIDYDKENTVETRLTKILKEYPDIELNTDGIPKWICVKSLSYKEDCGKDCWKSCFDCWNVPV